MRFPGFDPGAPTPDENTIRRFRDRLAETGALNRVMKAFDWRLRKKGYIPVSGRIVGASLAPAPKQRDADAGKGAIKAGKSASGIWPDKPNKAAQKDTNARRTLKTGGEARGRRALADDRHAGLRLQAAYQYRQAVRLHPRERGDIGGGPGWAHAATALVR